MLLFIITFGSSVSAQEINEDSLLQITSGSESTPVDLIQAHNKLARFYLRNDTAKANFHLDKLESLARSENDTTALIMTGDLRVRQLATKSKYQEAEARVYEMLRLSRLVKRQEFIGSCYTSLGVLKSMQYQEDSVLYYFEKAYQADLELPDEDTQGLANSLVNLGATALRYNKYDKSLNYYLEALEKAEASNFERGLNLVHSGLGLVYNKLKDNIKARHHQNESLRYARSLSDHSAIGNALHNFGGTYKEENPDSAIFYYRQALQSYERIGNKERIGLSAMATGDALINAERPLEALRYFEKAHVNYKTTLNRKRIIDAESRLAKANYEIGNYKKAHGYMDEVISYYESQNDLESSAKAFGLLSKIAEGLHDLPTALSARKRHQVLQDSLKMLTYNKDVAEITTRYETEVKEVEIEKQKIVIEKKENQNRSIVISSILGGLLLMAGFLGVLQRTRKNKEIAEQKAMLQTHKIEQLEKEKQILGMNAMIEGQEAERSRIAKDLHDGLGGLLSTVKAHFSNIQSEILKIEKINVYNKANELVDEACDEVRRISHNLMPGSLRLEGLKAAVQHLGEEMDEAHPFTVKVETIGFENRMEESQEVFIYRIIQEALNNIIKHAGAKEVLIQLSETKDEYHFIVEDDGAGFDPLMIESGLGLRSIQSRVDFIKGNLDVDTKLGVGTTLSWYVPK